MKSGGYKSNLSGSNGAGCVAFASAVFDIIHTSDKKISNIKFDYKGIAMSVSEPKKEGESVKLEKNLNSEYNNIKKQQMVKELKAGDIVRIENIDSNGFTNKHSIIITGVKDKINPKNGKTSKIFSYADGNFHPSNSSDDGFVRWIDKSTGKAPEITEKELKKDMIECFIAR